MNTRRLVMGLLFAVLLGLGIGIVHFTSLHSLRFTGAALAATVCTALAYYALVVVFAQAVGERIWLVMPPAGAVGGAVFAAVLGLSTFACVVAGALLFPLFCLLDRLGTRAWRR